MSYSSLKNYIIIFLFFFFSFFFFNLTWEINHIKSIITVLVKCDAAIENVLCKLIKKKEKERNSVISNTFIYTYITDGILFSNM